MRGDTRVALAVGVGYLLGRRRKFGKAAVMAAAMATGGIGGLGGAAVKRAVRTIGAGDALNKLSPELGAVGDRVKGELAGAAKAAATAAISNRINSLSDSLHDRASALQDPDMPAAAVGDVLRGRGRSTGQGGRGTSDRDDQEDRPRRGAERNGRRRASDEDRFDDEDRYDDERDEDEGR